MKNILQIKNSMIFQNSDDQSSPTTRKGTSNLKTKLLCRTSLIVILFVIANLFFINTMYAQIAQRGSGTSATTATTTLTINKPTGVVTGDVMVATFTTNGSSSTGPSLGGWNTVVTGVNPGQNHRFDILYKVAGSSEGSSYAFTLASANWAVGGIVAFYGVDASVFDVKENAIYYSTTSSTNVTTNTGITTTINNDAVIMFGWAAEGAPTFGSWSTTSPGSLTEILDANYSSGSHGSIGVAWATQSSYGATGAGTATLSTNGTEEGGLLIALKPDAESWVGGTSTDWNNQLNWSPAHVPTSNTAVTIPNTNSGHWPAISSGENMNCNSLTFSGSLSELDFTGGGSLTVAGNVSFSNGVITSSTSASTLSVGGTWTGSGTTFTPNTYLTVNFTGAAQTIPQLASNYYNLILSGSGTDVMSASTTSIGGNLTIDGTVSTSLAANLTVSGNLSVGDGTTLTAGAYTLGITGTTTIGEGASGILSITSATGTKTFSNVVTINNGGAITESAAATLSFGNDVTINTGGTLTEYGAATVGIAGSLSNSGTYTASTGVHTFSGTGETISGSSATSIPSVTFSGTYTNSGTLTVTSVLTQSGTGSLTNGNGTSGILNINFTGTPGIGTSLIANTTGNTVNYGYAGTQTLLGITYYNLTISGSGTKTAGGAITVAGNLTISAGTFADGGYTVTVNGNVTNNGTHSGAGEIYLYGGSGSHAVTGTTDTYGNLELNDAQGATFANTSGTTTVGTLTVTAGTMTLNSFTTSLTVTTTNVTGTLTFNNATGTRSMGAVTVNTGGIVNVSTAQSTPLLTVASLNLNDGTWNNSINEPVTITTGNFTNTGTFTSGTGTYTFSGASQSINGNATTFTSITVSST
ncbi:MAG: hypothetical protein NTW49_05730, partial [Bacteroidia bacterium]|nr:hypothetical protein [Bacteroidia bacterium]